MISILNNQNIINNPSIFTKGGQNTNNIGIPNYFDSKKPGSQLKNRDSKSRESSKIEKISSNVSQKKNSEELGSNLQGNTKMQSSGYIGNPYNSSTSSYNNGNSSKSKPVIKKPVTNQGTRTSNNPSGQINNIGSNFSALGKNRSRQNSNYTRGNYLKNNRTSSFDNSK